MSDENITHSVRPVVLSPALSAGKPESTDRLTVNYGSLFEIRPRRPQVAKLTGQLVNTKERRDQITRENSYCRFRIIHVVNTTIAAMTPASAPIFEFMERL
jgi:hypothetical protein